MNTSRPGKRLHAASARNFLNLPQAERRRAIYRIISLERLFQMFADRSNYLVKPIKWDDPFENFIARLKGRLPSGEIVEFAQRYDFFGQCWTLTGGTDAMWRIYSSDKRSVRIKVRLARLYEHLACYALGVSFIGRVRYLSEDELRQSARRVVNATRRPALELLAKTFLVKRIAFAHENEVRLLCCAVPNEQALLYRHPFDCHAAIEEITLDPRLERDEAARVSTEIRVRTEYRGRIVQSRLYAPPEDFVLPLNASYSSLPRTYERVTYAGELRTTTMDPSATPQIVLPERDATNGIGANVNVGRTARQVQRP